MKPIALSLAVFATLSVVACAEDAATSQGSESDMIGSNDGSRLRVAGFDFDGFGSGRVAGLEVCPEVVDAVAEACRAARGKATAVAGCKTLCSVPVAPAGRVAGFDFEGYRAGEIAGNELCPEIVDGVAQACHAAGGIATAIKGCASVCSTPVAPNGQVAGFDFAGLKILPAPPATPVVCPAVLAPEEEACARAGGRTLQAGGCTTLCSTPIAAAP